MRTRGRAAHSPPSAPTSDHTGSDAHTLTRTLTHMHTNAHAHTSHTRARAHFAHARTRTLRTRAHAHTSHTSHTRTRVMPLLLGTTTGTAAGTTRCEQLHPGTHRVQHGDGVLGGVRSHVAVLHRGHRVRKGRELVEVRGELAEALHPHREVLGNGPRQPCRDHVGAVRHNTTRAQREGCSRISGCRQGRTRCWEQGHAVQSTPSTRETKQLAQARGDGRVHTRWAPAAPMARTKAVIGGRAAP
jgi:hypothetical protein